MIIIGSKHQHRDELGQTPTRDLTGPEPRNFLKETALVVGPVVRLVVRPVPRLSSRLSARQIFC